MKSIKEKAEEYADEQGLRMAYNGSCDNCRQGFVVGANYVLDHLSKTITVSRDGYLYDNLKKMIEQLKK